MKDIGHAPLLILALLTSTLSGELAPSVAQSVAIPGRMAGPAQSSLTPLSSALHILEPLSRGSGHTADTNAVLVFEQSIAGFEAVTIAWAGTSQIAEGMSFPETITLQNYTYHTSWQPTKDQVGDDFDIVFAVAGLTLDTLDYQATNRRTLPIKFFIESHPRIRARVMHAQNSDANEIAARLLSEYRLSGADTTLILFDEEFLPLEIGRALVQVYAPTAEQAASWLHAAGMIPDDTAEVLHVVFSLGATRIAGILLAEYELPGEDTTRILIHEAFPPLDIGRALQQVYAATAQQAAGWLQLAGMTATNTGQVLAVVYGLPAADTARVLRIARYGVDQVFLALKSVFSIEREDVEDALVAGGFAAEEAFRVVLPDLLAWYDGLLGRYGPTVYLHPLERFRMSGVDWFLDRVSLQYEIGGQTFTYDDSTNGVTTANLSAIVDDLKAQGATDFWLGTIAQFDDAVKAGDQGTAQARVHVLRLKDTGYTDFSFWIWYPYNGPGTFHAKATIRTFVENLFDIPIVVETDAGDFGNATPLGEHYSDWENIVVRTDTRTGDLVGVFMSAHGDYSFSTPANGLTFDAAGHPNLYASLNGHAQYPAVGDNPNVLKNEDLVDLAYFFSFSLFADLKNYTQVSADVLNVHSRYQIDGVDHYFLDASRQLASSSWIAFDGVWGPAHPLNLSNSQKVAIVKRIAGPAIADVRLAIPRLAADGCALIAAPCAVFFGLGYFGCFAGCMAGLVVSAELALDPLLDAYGPALLSEFPADDQVLDGKPSPGSRKTEWQYLRYPKENPPLLQVRPLPEQVAGTVDVVVAVSNTINVPVPDSYNVSIARVELFINEDVFDITNSPTTGGYMYRWDTTPSEVTSVPDGRYELHARLTDTQGKTYEYSWDRVEVWVANHDLIFDPLVLSTTRIEEGGAVSLTGKFCSPSTNSSSIQIEWGDGSSDPLTLNPGIRQFSAVHTYLQDSASEYPILVSLDDGTTFKSRTAQVQVANVSPAITSLTVLDDLVPLAAGGASARFDAAFSDAGLLDGHTAAWEWGDGLGESQMGAVSPLVTLHTYAHLGVYGVDLTVVDSQAGTTSAMLPSYVTVYDPNAFSYFTGSGTVIAPVDSTRSMMGTDTVEAPFGFILEPATGIFSLRLRLGDSEFFSDSYSNWQANASRTGGTITGRGTLAGANYVNGMPYHFVLTGTVATFRFQVWVPDGDLMHPADYEIPEGGLVAGEILFKPAPPPPLPRR